MMKSERLEFLKGQVQEFLNETHWETNRLGPAMSSRVTPTRAQECIFMALVIIQPREVRQIPTSAIGQMTEIQGWTKSNDMWVEWKAATEEVTLEVRQDEYPHTHTHTHVEAMKIFQSHKVSIYLN